MVGKFTNSLGTGKHINRIILYSLLLELYYVIKYNSSVVNYNTVDILQSSGIYITFLFVTFYIIGIIFVIPYVALYFGLMFAMRYLYFFPFLRSRYWKTLNRWQNRHKLDVQDVIGYSTHVGYVELHRIAQKQIDRYKITLTKDATNMSSFIVFINLILVSDFEQKKFLHIFSEIAGNDYKYLIYYGLVTVVIWQFALRLALSAIGFISSMKLQDS